MAHFRINPEYWQYRIFWFRIFGVFLDIVVLLTDTIVYIHTTGMAHFRINPEYWQYRIIGFRIFWVFRSCSVIDWYLHILLRINLQVLLSELCSKEEVMWQPFLNQTTPKLAGHVTSRHVTSRHVTSRHASLHIFYYDQKCRYFPDCSQLVLAVFVPVLIAVIRWSMEEGVCGGKGMEKGMYRWHRWGKWEFPIIAQNI